MLQSFQSGAVNIVEKLKVAYLYLLDGFPEFAKTDIEAIGKDLATMQTHAEKIKTSTENSARSVEEIETGVKTALDTIKRKRNDLRDEMRSDRSQKENYSSYQNAPTNQRPNRSTRGNFLSQLCCCVQGGDEEDQKSVVAMPNTVTAEPKSVKLDLNEAKEKFQKLNEDAELFELTSTVLCKASQILRECGGVLNQMLDVVNEWYLENKEVVTPSMEENIRRAEGMSEQEKTAHWESMVFVQQVQHFYTR
jgi:hypothetical protein